MFWLFIYFENWNSFNGWEIRNVNSRIHYPREWDPNSRSAIQGVGAKTKREGTGIQRVGSGIHSFVFGINGVETWIQLRDSRECKFRESKSGTREETDGIRNPEVGSSIQKWDLEFKEWNPVSWKWYPGTCMGVGSAVQGVGMTISMKMKLRNDVNFYFVQGSKSCCIRKRWSWEHKITTISKTFVSQGDITRISAFENGLLPSS